jgi:hypothetical protein
MAPWGCTEVDGADEQMWETVGALVERAPSPAALRLHGVDLIAAARRRADGRSVPDDARARERTAALMALAAPVVLPRIRAACDGRVMVMKGPEIAARYPDPSTRFFRDLDLLVDDPDGAQRALVSAGFVPLGDDHEYRGRRHLSPLVWPGLPLAVEVHRAPSRPSWLPAAPVGELMTMGVASACGPGLLAPPPPAHALLLTAHAWSHRPLGRLADLIDVAVALDDADRAEAARLARRWGWARMWATTVAAIDDLLLRRERSTALRRWARHLPAVREISVAENHLLRFAAAVTSSGPARAPLAVGATLVRASQPDSDEGWRDKLRRSRGALRHPLGHAAVTLDPWRR